MYFTCSLYKNDSQFRFVYIVSCHIIIIFPNCKIVSKKTKPLLAIFTIPTIINFLSFFFFDCLYKAILSNFSQISLRGFLRPYSGQ